MKKILFSIIPILFCINALAQGKVELKSKYDIEIFVTQSQMDAAKDGHKAHIPKTKAQKKAFDLVERLSYK